MKTIQYTFWQDAEYYIGFINDYPDYYTQGLSKKELIDNLKSLLADIESGDVPYIRQIETFEII